MMEVRGLSVYFWTCVAYLLFVIYGSMVPFDYNPVPFDQALTKFKSIPYLNLGIESRADWVANGVLYIPVGFLICQCLLQLSSRFLIIFTLSFILSAILAFGIEYTQLFFPPRTISINDLIAEVIGSGLGVLISGFSSNWYGSLIKSFFVNFDFFPKYILDAYLIFYVSYCVFPFDFLISGSEIQNKINSDEWGWFFATSALNDSFFQNFARLSLEAAMAVPIGILLGRFCIGRYYVIIISIFFGVLVEFLQFFIASGVSQGFSVVSRIIGFVLGARLYYDRFKWSFSTSRNFIRSLLFPLVVLYFIGVFSITGWFSQSWSSLDQAFSKLCNETNFLPFYYHYFTTEAIALQSLVSIVFLYIPVGIFCWALQKLPFVAGFLSFIFCSVIEISKLFIISKHADPTNLIISFVTNYILVKILFFAENYRSDLYKEKINFKKSLDNNIQQVIKQKIGAIGYFYILLVCPLYFYWIFNFPVLNDFLLIASLLLFSLIWFRPKLIFFIIPIALPLLDLAPWSGRFFFDEFDVLVIISLLIGFLKLSRHLQTKSLPNFFVLSLWLIATSCLISTVLGLLPLQPLDSNALSNYLSNYNALRISKGVLWFFLLFFLAKKQNENGIHVEFMFRRGMIFGLLGSIIFILVERFYFTGFFDFSNEHRVVGPFSAMHIGGAYVECFLVVCVPFLLKEVLETSRTLVRFFGAVLLGLATYAVMVTFSRGGYLAFAVSILFYLIFELIKKFDDLKIKRLLTISVVITMVIFSAIPVVSGNFAQSRLSSIEHDFNTRLEHWKETINMVDNNWISQSFGMGVGKFPIIYYLTSLEESRSGYYSVINDDGQSYIRLGVGKGLYIDQAITSPLIMPLTVKFKVRVTAGKGQIGFSVCQKWLLASANCNWQTSLINQTNKWLDQQVTLDQNQIGISTEFSLVPYFFSFTNTSQAMIDISEIRLVNHQGENLLSNGSFQDGMDHWFFQADQHLPWHVKNLFLAIYFDQGLFGFIVFVALLILAVIWAIRTRQEDWTLALVAFIFVGFFDSLIDSPRFFLLLMILLSFPFLFKPSIVIK